MSTTRFGLLLETGGVVRPLTPAAIAGSSAMTGRVSGPDQTGGSVSATSAVTGSLQATHVIAGATIAATSAVTARSGALRPLTLSAIAATSTVAGHVTGHVVVAPAAIAATSALTGSVAGNNLITPAAVTATSTLAGHVTGHIVIAPAAIQAFSYVIPIFGPFVDATGLGPGNGGETFPVTLAPNGTSVTATLVGSITDTATLLELTSDAGLPAGDPFVLQIDDEVLYVAPIGGHLYRIRRRGLSNTVPAVHITGVGAAWGDSYDMAIAAAADIAHQFTADITTSGSTTYPGWLICFDSSQAYLSGSRYPMHVTSVLGVFGAGAGSGGTNRCDAAQPNAICSAVGASDDCPAALSNPSRISSDILIGDVALVRYTNPEASVLTLGPRSASLQSWFGLKRVDATDHDVTFTDPNGIVVDTTGAESTFTGAVNGEWLDPLGAGINPDSGDPVANVYYTSVTLAASKRKFTRSVGAGGYGEKGWPICCVAVRNGNRRVPLWRSWDWHNFNYVFSGFDTDALYCQLLVEENGIVFGSVPSVDFPNDLDVSGPDAVWDDNTYEFAASWYVAIFSTPYLVVGPSVGGQGGTSSGGGVTTSGVVPVVTFPSGPGSPVVVTPPAVEGGSGGDIPPPTARKQRFYATLV